MGSVPRCLCGVQGIYMHVLHIGIYTHILDTCNTVISLNLASLSHWQYSDKCPCMQT